MKKKSVLSLIIVLLCVICLACNGVIAILNSGAVEKASAITSFAEVVNVSYDINPLDIKDTFSYNEANVTVQNAKCVNKTVAIDQMISMAVDLVYDMDGAGGTYGTGFFARSKADIIRFANILSAMRGVEGVKIDEKNRYLNGSYYAVKFTVTDSFKYFYALDSGDESKLSAQDLQTIQKLREIVEASGDLATAYDKEKFFHDYLVKNVAYGRVDQSRAGSTQAGQTPYEVLIEGAGYSKGYAATFDLLLKMSGIPCQMVKGTAATAAGSGAHFWNQVQIDGEWYNVDVTWDDPTPNTSGTVVYTYFNLDDETFYKNHTPEADNQKECISVKNYGVIREYTEFKTQDEVMTYVADNYGKDIKTVEFRYAGQDELGIQAIVNEMNKGLSYSAIDTAFGVVYRMTFE